MKSSRTGTHHPVLTKWAWSAVWTTSFLSLPCPSVDFAHWYWDLLPWGHQLVLLGSPRANAHSHFLAGHQRRNKWAFFFKRIGVGRRRGHPIKHSSENRSHCRRQALQMWHQLLASEKQAWVWMEDTCSEPQKLDLLTLARLAGHPMLMVLLTLNVFACPYQVWETVQESN